PQWASNGREALLSSELGKNEVWKEGVSLWWKLEASTEFATSVKGFGTEGRPGAVHTWIKNARKKKPVIKNMERLAEEVEGWWKRVNPGWRLVDDELITDPLGGDWEAMRQRGANGFLGVLIALKWWREAEGETKEWRAIFDDVVWVMGVLI
ncbi:hypothetical protein C8R46DRAFT_928220, partial [Mycena filopes]